MAFNRYDYIAAAEPTSVDEIYKVEAFKEKPNLETAEQYLAAGNYYWNAGIFVWNIDTISKAIRIPAKPCQHHG